MPTIDVTKGQKGQTHAGSRGVVVISNEIDFFEQNIAALDVVEAISLGAGDRVLSVVVNVITVEGAVLTFDIGDAADPNGYLAAVNGNAVAITGMNLLLTEALPNTVTAYTGGKLYTVADTIDLTFAHVAGAGKVKVSALIARMG